MCLLDNRIFSRINNLTFQARTTITSKQVLVPKRGKKKYQHFLYPVNHLNQRKSPSAPLVSKEIETDFFRRRFSRSREKFPKGREFRCITGAHIKSKISILRNQYVKSNEFWVSHPLVGALMCPSKRGSNSSSTESLASSGKDMLEATLLHLNSALRIFFFFSTLSLTP